MRRLLLAAAAGLLLGACAERGVEAEVVFDRPVTASPGATVLLRGDPVGKVLSATDGRVRIRIAADAAPRVSADAVVVPASGGGLALRNPLVIGEHVRDGQSLRGLGSEWDVLASDVVEVLGGAVQQISRSLEQYLASEDWRQRKGRISEQLAALGEEADRSVRELSEGLSRLVTELETGARQDLDRQRGEVRALAEELRVDLERAQKEGRAALAEALRALQAELGALEQQLEPPEER